ncbi:MAG: hypothetical protein ACLSHR_11170 [Oscillospiraceae bacterium]
MIVFFNAKTITCISEMLVRIFEEYEYEYENVKKSIDISDKNLDVIWSPVWVEPYHSDFILEIDDNTAPIRKKWKRNKLPINLNGYSQHFFKETKPVYSVFLGEQNKPICEKIFVCEKDKIIGLKYLCGSHTLLQVTIEHIEGDGEISQYDCMDLLPHIQNGNNDFSNSNEMSITSRKYYYEKKYIIKAESINNYNNRKEIVWYNNENFNNVGNVLPSNCPQMNPMELKEFSFIYDISGNPISYTRKSYYYGKVSEKTWKFPSKLIKIYSDFDISNFKKE